MPTIVLTLSQRHDPKLTKRIVDEVIEITNTVLNKPLGRTALILRYVSPDEWFIAGKSLAELQRSSFRVEVTAVDETVTKVQKAAYCRRIFEQLSLLIDNLHPFSNIHVVDVRSAAYGYGGLTQEYAQHHPDEAKFLEIE
jgi:4-oxalocrotonate tautomerase